jgi:quinol monooxygenase YgiN
MLLIVGTIRLPPEGLDAARGAMRTMVEASRAEPGCLSYSYGEDVLEPGLMRVAEVWSDRAALDAHFRSAHMAAWRSAFPIFGFTERALSLYEAGAPVAI